MPINSTIIEKTLEPYLVMEGSIRYLPENRIQDVTKVISEKYSNVYSMVQDIGCGLRVFIVGNLGSKVKKPLFKVAIK